MGMVKWLIWKKASNLGYRYRYSGRGGAIHKLNFKTKIGGEYKSVDDLCNTALYSSLHKSSPGGIYQ